MSFDQFTKEFEAFLPLVERINNLFVEIESLIVEKSGQKPPKRLFHYTSAQGLEGIITNSSLWATDCRFLNDSKEMKDGLEILSSHLSNNNRDVFNNFSQTLIDYGPMLGELNVPHVVSFCSESDLLSQWRAYASEAEGYCIEFDVSDSRLSSCNDATVVIGFMLPVIYEDTAKKEIIDEITTRLETILIENNINSDNLDSLSDTQKGILTGVIYNVFTLPLLSFKHKGFSEEMEWRAVFYPNSVEIEKLRKFRSASGAFVPYIEAIFLQGDDERLFQREAFPIVSVCLPPASGEISKKGLEMYLKSQGLAVGNNGVKVKNSSIPLRSKKAIHW